MRSVQRAVVAMFLVRIFFFENAERITIEMCWSVIAPPTDGGNKPPPVGPPKDGGNKPPPKGPPVDDGMKKVS